MFIREQLHSSFPVGQIINHDKHDKNKIELIKKRR
jgi:hypothetical protein